MNFTLPVIRVIGFEKMFVSWGEFTRFQNFELIRKILAIDYDSNIMLRDACKKKSLILCLFETGGGGGGRPKLNCLENPENERFFFLFQGKKSLILYVLETKGGG